MFARYLEHKLQKSQMPVIFVNGARQAGKSTLVKKVFAHSHDYFTLDDPHVLSLVMRDPLNFIRHAKNPMIIDEVQRYPELLLAIKTQVDERRVPQNFILTGSVNILLLNRVKDSLAGRMAIYTLWPLSQEEIQNTSSSFLADLFLGKLTIPKTMPGDVSAAVQKGGYPLSVLAPNQDAQKEWFSSYVNQILEKDIRDLSQIEGLREIPNILGLLATRVGSLLNLSDLSRSLQIPHMTLKRYLGLLHMTYLFCPLQPWFQNIGQRMIKSEKSFLIDTGLLGSILHKDLQTDPLFWGHALENFVYMEIKKQLSYKYDHVKLYHYRTLQQEEVDFVLEDQKGDIIAIEVKASSQFFEKSLKGLRSLQEKVTNKFKMGILLYTGTQVVPVGNNIYAVPLHYLYT